MMTRSDVSSRTTRGISTDLGAVETSEATIDSRWMTTTIRTTFAERAL